FGTLPPFSRVPMVLPNRVMKFILNMKSFSVVLEICKEIAGGVVFLRWLYCASHSVTKGSLTSLCSKSYNFVFPIDNEDADATANENADEEAAKADEITIRRAKLLDELEAINKEAEEPEKQKKTKTRLSLHHHSKVVHIHPLQIFSFCGLLVFLSFFSFAFISEISSLHISSSSDSGSVSSSFSLALFLDFFSFESEAFVFLPCFFFPLQTTFHSRRCFLHPAPLIPYPLLL
nr:hypothetical protein [Tanacetum cinerariifolium]